MWIVDVGCGTGWFVNTAARYYRVRALGVDLCLPALNLACQVSESVGLRKRVGFIQADLFDLPLRRKFFLVNSIGVLHHTYDCHRALASIARLVDDNGYLHVGLYHAYGRAPFLDLFRRFRDELAATSGPQARAAIEERAFQLYRALDRRDMDEQALRSWFRDQVFHPHETQHTLQEVCGWLIELGFEPLSTSINRFAPVSDWGAVFEQEPQWREISYQRNVVDRVYFPGFFVVLAKRTAR